MRFINQIRAFLLKHNERKVLVQPKGDGSTMVTLTECMRCHNFNYSDKISFDPISERLCLCEFCKSSYDEWLTGSTKDIKKD